MKFGYTIIYTEDVLKSLEFFEHAFGLNRHFIHESGDYGELKTGDTVLAYASHTLGHINLPNGYVKVSGDKPLGMEIGLVTPEVAEAYQRALNAGAVPLHPPVIKPWGQTVAYVRCPDGTLVELCSPMGL
ncbi:MAG: VOC family protein [Gammaproteobacteria bacterium]|nr:VOC family protein [Gammaproteobacteria bacterium]